MPVKKFLNTSQKTETQTSDEMTAFEIEYFIQTRKEIDTEKQERNKILNYAILTVGGISLALYRVGETLIFFRSPAALVLYIPLLFLISVLVAALRAKLRQIGDRWFVLEAFLMSRSYPKDWISLETVVCKGLREKRYLSDDFLLHLGLCLVPYLLIIWVATALPLLPAIGLCCLVVTHITVSSILLHRPVPQPDLEKTTNDKELKPNTK